MFAVVVGYVSTEAGNHDAISLALDPLRVFLGGRRRGPARREQGDDDAPGPDQPSAQMPHVAKDPLQAIRDR
jgi:hypothetical protein